jgi:hypothetical protein
MTNYFTKQSKHNLITHLHQVVTLPGIQDFFLFKLSNLHPRLLERGDILDISMLSKKVAAVMVSGRNVGGNVDVKP